MAITMLLFSIAGAWADDYDPQNPPDPNAYFKLTVSVSPSEAGYISGGGRFKEGQQVWLSTSPRANYDFLYWICEGVQISNEQSFYYTMPAKSVNIEAVFAFNPVNPADPTTGDRYRLYLENNMEGSCTFNLTSGAKQTAGQSIFIIAQNISQGFKFLGWYLNNELVSETPSFYYTMPYQDVTLSARFTYDPDSPVDPISSQTDIDNKDYILGDANGDGEVNVTDIVEIVNAIMNRPSERFVRAAADMNGDGEIDVADIVKVVSIIMSSNSNASRRAAVAEMVDNDQLEMTSNENQTLSLNLQNEGSYVASQFDIVLSAAQTLESIQLNSKRMENHQLTYAKIGDNRYKVVIYSFDNAIYKGHSGKLLDIKVAGSGDVSVEDILFITAGQIETNFPPLCGGTTGISVTMKQTEKLDVYSIDGRMIGKQMQNLNGLEKGIYIVNGQKYIVK